MREVIGRTLGPYRIVEQLGVGGMAIVYKAYHPAMDRYIAFKIPSASLLEDAQFRARFQREARTIAHLEHSHILPVYDFGEDDGIPYLVMRYVDGGTLRDLASRGILPLDQAIRLIAEVAEALAYAHSKGVIHRDVKPANVLLDRDGSALLTDFGIAKLVEQTLLLTGTVALGTPYYMAPEQVSNKPVDARTDIYALGVMLYELLTGQRPFEGETPLAVALKHVTDPLPPPRLVNPALPETAEQIILKAMAKDPADRYQQASDLARDLRRLLLSLDRTPNDDKVQTDNEVQSERVPEDAGRPRDGELVRRRAPWRGIAAAGVVVVAVLGLLVLRPFSGTPTGLATQANALSTPTASSAAAQKLGELPHVFATLTVVASGTPNTVATDAAISQAAQPTAIARSRAATSIDTPTPTPVTLYADDFSNENSGWPTGARADYAFGYKANTHGQGYYAISVLRSGNETNGYSSFAWHGGEYSDFGYAADVTLPTTTGVAACGLNFRRQNGSKSDYELLVSTSGRYDLVKRLNDKLTYLIPWTSSPQIRTGATTNRLGVEADGDRMSVSINGVTVGTVTDSSIWQGQIGLMATTWSDPMTCRFSNLRVTAPLSATSSVPTATAEAAVQSHTVAPTPPAATISVPSDSAANLYLRLIGSHHPTATISASSDPALKALAGDWRIVSQRIYYDQGGGGAWSSGDTSQDLQLSADGTWTFGGSSGQWEIQPITTNDWTNWKVNAYGPKRKIVVHGWNHGEASGPIEESGQRVDFVWVVYRVGPPTVSAPGLVYVKFGQN